MQDEEMDNMDELIREASKSHHPVYDDKAWEKMEILLDQHLPIKKERKRPAIIFLWLLFTVGVAFFAIVYQLPHKKEAVSAANKGNDIPLNKLPEPTRPANANLPARVPKTDRNMFNPFVRLESEKYAAGNLKKPSRANYLVSKRTSMKTTGPETGSAFTLEDNLAEKTDKLLPESDEQVFDDIKNKMPVSSDELHNPQEKAIIQIIKNDSAAGIIANDTTILKASAPIHGKLPRKSGLKKGFINNFAISLSAGPDLSFVIGNASKTRLNYGAGLSYSFANRVTVRSGFYVAKKSYAAKPADYHPPGGYWTYNANLQKIEADCNVFEIPLSASYNFKRATNHNWFGGIGFSTFLMKRETYNYLYKDAWGQERKKIWTLLNGSNHYFSVLTISGGYQYRLSPYFSISAEPYLKLPLHGIGFGKIRLNSAGLLLTASIQPLVKRK